MNILGSACSVPVGTRSRGSNPSIWFGILMDKNDIRLQKK